MPASVAAALGVQFSLNWLEEDPLDALTAWFVGGPMALTFGALNHRFNSRPNVPEVTPPLFNRTQSVRQAITPWQWIYGRTRVGGAITFIECSSDNVNLHLVITLAGHEVEDIEEIWFDDEVIALDGSGEATGRLAGFARVKKSFGSEAAGVQPFPELVSESASKWTNAHCQTGRAKIYVRLKWNQDLYPSGIPQISAVVKGRKVYDPRTTLTAWSDNAALCVADYLMSDVGLGCDIAEIDTAQLIAAANTSDEAVSLDAGGTEARYTLNGAFDSSATPRDMLPQLLSAMAGSIRFIGGTWGVYAGAYATPALTLTQDDLRGPIHVMPRLSKRDLCNAVKGISITEANKWQPSDYAPVTNATYLSEDQGERIWRELNLPFTTSTSAAQRIAKIELERNRQQITVEWPGKLNCYQLQAGDTVQVTLSRYGWSAKVFEVATSTLVHENASDGIALGCDLVLRETASAVFDWNSGEEQTIDPAPDSNLPNPFTVAVPGAPDVAEELYETRDGRGVAVKAIVSWASAADAFVDRYQLEYRVRGDQTWIVQAPVAGLSQDISDITPGRYDFRVKAINTLSVSSAYAVSVDKEIVGLGAPPSDPEILGLQVAGGLAYLSLSPHPDLDVRRGGRWRVRFVHEGLAVAWESGFSIGEPDTYMGDQTNLVLPLKPGVYMVRAEDSSGAQSTGFAYIQTKQASVLTYTSLTTVQEDAAFSGSVDDVIAAAGVLTLGGTGLLDDASDFDAIDNFDYIGGNALEGTYTFSASHDFGAVTRVRLTGRIEGTIVNNMNLVDERVGDLDDWLDFEGSNDAGGSAADAFIEMRETDDDPGGTPTWSAWKRLDASEHEAWGVEYRAVLLTNDPAYRPEVTVLRVNADTL